MDKGFNKTEFITTLISLIGLIIQMLKSSNPEIYAIAISLLTAVYTICRTIYKQTETKLDDEIVRSIEKILNEK